MLHDEAESSLFKSSWCSSLAHWGSIPKNPVVISWGNFAGDFLNKSVDFKRKKYKQVSFLPWAHGKPHILSSAVLPLWWQRWRTWNCSHKCKTIDHNMNQTKKKALFPKPQSIDRSRIRYTCPLLHCDSKQRPKPPDVNSHRNATRQILQ